MQKDAAGQPVPTVISARSPIGLLLACAMACLPLVAQAQQGLRLPGTEERSPYSSPSPFGQDGPELPRSGGTSPLDADKPGIESLDRIVAVVNQGVITESELQAQIHLIEGRAAQTSGAGVPPPDELRKQVLEQMILQLAQEQYAADYGLKPSDAEVDRAVADVAQNNGLSTQQLTERLKDEGVSLDTFRRQLVAKARKGADFGTLAQENSEASDAATGGNMGWRKADDLPGLFADTVRKLKPGEISVPVRSPAGFHILKLQDRRDSGATTVELTHARHILLPANSPETAAEAERRLSLFRRDIEAGKADFAKLAKEFSSDGSAAKGGDLGWLYPGDTVPEFEQAMKSLHDGEISEPVQTQFGVHLVQVLGRRTDTESPERLRNAARAKLREAKGGEAYQQWLRELRDRTYVEYRQKSDAASTH